ncbi:MAG TPA: LytTR family DNA-binding domain-containing protein [Rhodothermales bacterium]|nr:LytTR family DNA-binding domain-containing protein [Rhodothermales bacterium]
MIVDDEPLARERLRRLLAQAEVPVEVVGAAASGDEAVPLIHEMAPDVVFLDVQMPVLDGFDVVDLLMPPRPAIIFTTAFDEYALRAFEAHALDYLTKPVRLERLNGALRRIAAPAGRLKQTVAMDELTRERGARLLHRLTVEVGRHLRVVQIDEIRYIESDDRLVFVHLAGGRHLTSFTLDELEQRLDPVHFVRIHRSYIVNLRHVRELIPWFSDTYRLRLLDGTELPVARRRVQAVKRELGR